jgi:protein phosphatase 1 regulatory subunit 7
MQLRLRILDISNNQIAKLEGLKQLQDLEELWANHNELALFTEMEAELGGLAKLETVYFEGNPLETSHKTQYRLKIKLALPQIKQIDATAVRQ